jgi:hypothetical protein
MAAYLYLYNTGDCMFHRLTLIVVVLCGMAFAAKDICDSASNYRLYETSRKCFSLGNNLAYASLGLLAIAGVSTLASNDMPYFFLALAPVPLLASAPFYITGGIQRALYNSHRGKCGNFRRTDLSMSSAASSGLSYCISVEFEY